MTRIVSADTCYEIRRTPSINLRAVATPRSVALTFSVVLSVLFVFGGCTTSGTSNETANPLAIIDRAAFSIATGSSGAAARSRSSPTILISPVIQATELAQFNEFVARRIGQQLSTLPNVALVTRDHISEVVNEIEFQQLEHWNAAGDIVPLFDQETVLQVGSFYGASHLLIVGAEDLPGYLEINAILVEVATAQVYQYSELVEETPEIGRLIRTAIRELEAEKAKLEAAIADVEAQLADQQAELDNLMAQGRNEIEERLGREERQLRQSLEDLEEQIRSRSTVLTEYQTLYQSRQSSLAAIESQIQSILERIEREDNLVENYVINGMTMREVASIVQSINTSFLGDSAQATFTVRQRLRPDYGVETDRILNIRAAGNHYILFDGTDRVIGYVDTTDWVWKYRPSR